MFSPNRREFISGAAACAAYAALGRGVDGTHVGMRKDGHPLCEVGKFVPTAKDYVQNGLVAMWDGIENAGWGTHDASAKIWKDVVRGNANFDISQYFSIAEKSVDVTDVRAGNVVQDIATIGYADFIDAKSNGTFSIEVVFSSTTGKNGMYGNSGSYCVASPLSIGYSTTYVPVSVSLKGATNWTSEGKININPCHTWDLRYVLQYSLGSISYPKVYAVGFIFNGFPGSTKYSASISASGEIVATGTMDRRAGNIFESSFDDFYLCNFGLNRSMATVGSIYSIRVYKKTLSAAEVAHNYAIDRARFNLP